MEHVIDLCWKNPPNFLDQLICETLWINMLIWCLLVGLMQIKGEDNFRYKMKIKRRFIKWLLYLVTHLVTGL